MPGAVCTSVYRFHPTPGFRPWPLDHPGLGVSSMPRPVCTSRGGERWDPGAALGSALAVASQPSAVPGREGNMWTLAGVSRAEPWDPRIRIEHQPKLPNSLV